MELQMPAAPDHLETREAIITACLDLNRSGVNQGTSGNISVRIGDRFLVTPSGVPYEQMTPEMIVELPLDGTEVRPGQMKPSTEWPFHQAILRAKPQMQAVVHAHPVSCSALAMNRLSIPACHYMVAAFGGYDVPLADYALFGSQELSDNVTQAMADRSGCLMANHGAVVCGETLAKAMWRMVELETLARGYVASLSIGTPHILSTAEMDAVLEGFATYGPRPASDPAAR
ncbi:class II aldolase/adducin family protein [Tritonibacter horizontis]|uniref:L-fuculose phosphate aldolase n=1 Tax=Tritonibacter horizontis TaxID=1768241 RepID=A0A132BWB4_9RHOB|nr:class II aldolase/adducin family protein [Tritonibacter horizontis]KUP92679.1 L-fuculose phosphate aldolase [Tritonibacter horizontis]